MAVIEGNSYHIFNQGNNREQIFFSNDNYEMFLQLFGKHVLPNCEVLAYCLMPNHFHFLIHANELSAKPKRVGNIESTELANGFRLLQSRYAGYFNKEENRSGSLFRQKTKFKPVITNEINYGLIAFHYLHQNPYKAGLVEKLEDWKFSSFNDFYGLRKNLFCNQSLAISLLDLDMRNFYSDSYLMIDNDRLDLIF